MPKYGKNHISELIRVFEQTCKENGLRVTQQRRVIFDQLAGFSGHPTVENIFSRVRRELKAISLDTVYRTIALFEDYGLIKRIQILDNQARFDINLSVHHHFICTRCKKIEDFYWSDFDQMKPPKTISKWGQIEVKQVVISGLCSSCKKKK